MRQQKADGHSIPAQICVAVAIALLLASIFIPMFWRMDKSHAANLSVVGMVAWLVSVASFAAWFIKWLFDLTRPAALVLAVLIGFGMFWLFK